MKQRDKEKKKNQSKKKKKKKKKKKIQHVVFCVVLLCASRVRTNNRRQACGLQKRRKTYTKRIGGVRVGVQALCVHVTNIDLDRGVVLGVDEAVGVAALARDVEIHLRALFVLDARHDVKRNN